VHPQIDMSGSSTVWMTNHDRTPLSRTRVSVGQQLVMNGCRGRSLMVFASGSGYGKQPTPFAVLGRGIDSQQTASQCPASLDIHEIGYS
jgi:hypothetical protein